MGDLQSEESRDAVFELSLDALEAAREETSPQPLLEVEVTYFNVIKAQLGSVSTLMSVLRSGKWSRAIFIATFEYILFIYIYIFIVRDEGARLMFCATVNS